MVRFVQISDRVVRWINITTIRDVREYRIRSDRNISSFEQRKKNIGVMLTEKRFFVRLLGRTR